MKRICIALCLLIFPAIATITLATSALAQTVVVGTGNPDVDVPAVQAAVDQGGEIILKGHFSFDKPPTQPSEFPGYMVTILVSKAVAISGARDEDGRMREEDGEMTSIEAGTVPFMYKSGSLRHHSGIAVHAPEGRGDRRVSRQRTRDRLLQE